MVDTIYMELPKRAIDKSEMMLLDMLAHFDWKRPIHFTQVYTLQSLGLLDYLQFDGYITGWYRSTRHAGTCRRSGVSIRTT